MKTLRKLWNATREAAARLFKPRTQVIERATVIVRVIYMWRPSLPIRRCRIDGAAAAAAGQLSLF